jgi:hypothetical protein
MENRRGRPLILNRIQGVYAHTSAVTRPVPT